MNPTPRRPPKPTPVKPWQRVEAGRYRSSDERFLLESDGGGRWFVADEQERDELGLARTTGPYATLGAAKAAAEMARGAPPATSPLAARIADTAGRAGPRQGSRRQAPTTRPASGAPAASGDHPGGRPAGTIPVTSQGASKPAARVRTWIDELAERDGAAAKRATRLISVLEHEGIAGAEALVRRDLLGDRPAVATRLLARDIVAAIGALKNPTALRIAETVARVLATSKTRVELPGWELVELDLAGDRRRPIRLTRDDLTSAAGDD